MGAKSSSQEGLLPRARSLNILWNSGGKTESCQSFTSSPGANWRWARSAARRAAHAHPCAARHPSHRCAMGADQGMAGVKSTRPLKSHNPEVSYPTHTRISNRFTPESNMETLPRPVSPPRQIFSGIRLKFDGVRGRIRCSLPPTKIVVLKSR